MLTPATLEQIVQVSVWVGCVKHSSLQSLLTKNNELKQNEKRKRIPLYLWNTYEAKAQPRCKHTIEQQHHDSI